jgi:hypothetical protein
MANYYAIIGWSKHVIKAMKDINKNKSPLGNEWLSREFDPVVAREVGVEEAIMYRNIVFWCKINQAQGINFFKGKYWMYNTLDMFVTGNNGVGGFSFWTKKQVSRIINNLENSGYIISGNFNEDKRHKMKWYTYK